MLEMSLANRFKNLYRGQLFIFCLRRRRRFFYLKISLLEMLIAVGNEHLKIGKKLVWGQIWVKGGTVIDTWKCCNLSQLGQTLPVFWQPLLPLVNRFMLKAGENTHTVHQGGTFAHFLRFVDENHVWGPTCPLR